MGDAILAREGFTTLLDALTDNLVAWVRLYVNDVTPGRFSKRADFEELFGFGYEPFAIPRWTKGALRDGVAFSVPDIVHFVFGGPTYPPGIVGYYVTAGRTGPLLWAWRRPDGPFVPGPDKSVLTVFMEFDFPTIAEDA